MLSSAGMAIPGAAASTANRGQEAAANEVYLNTLENRLANGPIAARRQEIFLRELDRGVPRDVVVVQLLETPAVRSSMARATYFQLLGRLPTPSESSRLASVLRTGGLRRGLALVLAGPGYYQSRGGGTSQGFVTALYQDAVGRAPTAAESARLAGLLDRGGSRIRVVNKVLNSLQARVYLVAPALAVLGGTPASAMLLRAAKIASKPRGLNRLVSQTYGSSTYFARATAPPMTAPPTDTLTVNDHPPNLPMAPTFDLGTRWVRESQQSLVNVNGSQVSIPNNALISAAPDGSVWFADQGGSTAYSLAAQQPNSPAPTWKAFSIPPFYSIRSISAVSQDNWWVAFIDTVNGSNMPAVDTFHDSTQTESYFLPAGVIPEQISAASDGTVWVLSQAGQLYALNYGNFTPVDTDGYTIANFGVGSASNIWAVAVQGQGEDEGQVLLQDVNGTWQQQGFGLPPLIESPVYVSATADGSVWLYAAGSASNSYQTVVYLRPATTGVWAPAPNPAPGGAVQAIAGISQYRMAALATGNENIVEVLSVGITDQQAVPYPAMDAGEQAGYEYINQSLGVADVRTEYYTNIPFDESNYSSQVNSLAPPPNVSSADWLNIKNQIVDELNAVSLIAHYFDNVNTLNTDLQTVADNSLTEAYSFIGEANNTTDTTSTVTLLLERLLEAGTAGIAASFSGGGAIIAAVLSSAYSAAITDLTGNSNPDSSTALTSTYANLMKTVDNYYGTVATQTGNYETAILKDWGKIQAVSAAVKGPWAWSPTETPMIQNAAQPADDLFFYQALMPVKWQVVEYANTYCATNVLNAFCIEDMIPPYDIYQVSLGENQSGFPVYDDYFLNAVGSNTVIGPDSNNGAYPMQDLLQQIYSMGFSQRSLFTATNGWNLPVIVVNPNIQNF